MDIDEILKDLELNTGVFPKEALEAAIVNKDKITQDLLTIIQQATDNAESLLEKPNYWAHIYAMYLLSQFREKRAYPLLVEFFSLPGEISKDLTGDVVTESLHSILASVCCGDTSLITKLVEQQDIDEYTRDAALKALVTLVACGEKPREEVLAYYKSLFGGILTREPSWVWNSLVSCCVDLYPQELYEDIKQVFEEGLIDPFFIGFEDVEDRLKLGKDKTLAKLKSEYTLIDNTIEELKWWACFKQPKEQLSKPSTNSKIIDSKNNRTTSKTKTNTKRDMAKKSRKRNRKHR